MIENITVLGNIIIIEGQIRNVKDYSLIRYEVEKIRCSYDSIVFIIKDSKIITSSLASYIMKLINVDKLVVKVLVGNEFLYDVLVSVHLIDKLNVIRLDV